MVSTSNIPYAAGDKKDILPEQLLSSGPGINVVINAADHKIVYSNERLLAISGYTAEDIEAAGFSFLELIERPGRERFSTHIRDVCKGTHSVEKFCGYRLVDKKGQVSEWYMYASSVKMQAENNSPCFCHLYLLPETSHQTVPFLSFESRELFLEQFEQNTFGTFEWMIGSDKVFWSEGVYDIYEEDKDKRELAYSYVSSLTHPADVEMARNAVHKAMDEQSGFELELRIITASKQVKTVHSVGKVITTDTGDPVKIVGSIRDITAQRKMESDLEKHVLELNRSNKELEEFAYVASHDLQEPLRKITTFCDRLNDKYGELLSGDGVLYMERIVASAGNMRALINNLLEFSRITRDPQPFEDVNLKFVLHQVLNDLELSIEETDAKIIVGPMPVIKGSMSQMKQLFANIISNAIKFHKEGVSPVINIDATLPVEAEKERLNLLPAKQYHKITISDNGIGFDNEYAEKVFQIFQRLNGKSDYPGSGIGLAICKKIVDHHGGAIYAESSEGHGANFTIILPAA